MRYEKGNFIIVPNKSELKKLDAQSQVLFMWLCSFTDEKGQCYPSVNRLAECCGLSRKTIIERVKVLIEKGFLTKFHRFSENSQQSNLYQIHLLPSVPDTPPCVAESKKVVQMVHPPSESDTHRTKSTELDLLKQKKNKESFKNFRETVREIFKN